MDSSDSTGRSINYNDVNDNSVSVSDMNSAL